jgi:hypothetical protein
VVVQQSVLDAGFVPGNESEFDPIAVFHGWPSELESWIYCHTLRGGTWEPSGWDEQRSCLGLGLDTV